MSMDDLAEVWKMRQCEDVTHAAYLAAARALGAIDAAWSRTATSCRGDQPCYSCCLKALRAVEAAAPHLGRTER